MFFHSKYQFLEKDHKSVTERNMQKSSLLVFNSPRTKSWHHIYVGRIFGCPLPPVLCLLQTYMRKSILVLSKKNANHRTKETLTCEGFWKGNEYSKSMKELPGRINAHNLWNERLMPYFRPGRSFMQLFLALWYKILGRKLWHLMLRHTDPALIHNIYETKSDRECFPYIKTREMRTSADI